MDWVQHITNLPQHPSIQWLTLVLLFIFGGTALFSERTLKERFGGIPAAFQWLSRTKENSRKKKEEYTEKRIRSLEEGQIELEKRLQEQITELQKSESEQFEYIRWVTRLMRGIELWAAAKGLELPPPPFQTFVEWREQREAGSGGTTLYRPDVGH